MKQVVEPVSALETPHRDQYLIKQNTDTSHPQAHGYLLPPLFPSVFMFRLLILWTSSTQKFFWLCCSREGWESPRAPRRRSFNGWWLGWQGSARATGCCQRFAVCCGQRKLPPARKREIPRENAQKNPLQFWHLRLQDLGNAVMKPRGEGQAKLVANMLLA